MERTQVPRSVAIGSARALHTLVLLRTMCEVRSRIQFILYLGTPGVYRVLYHILALRILYSVQPTRIRHIWPPEGV